MANQQRRSSIPLPTTNPSPYRQQHNHITTEHDSSTTANRPKSVLIPRTSLDLTAPDGSRYLNSSPSTNLTPNGRHRRRSTTSLPPWSIIPSSTGTDFELLPFGSNNYTSLKDIIPGGSPLSPTTAAAPAASASTSASSPPSKSLAAAAPIAVGNSSIASHEISIRNRLVKQAAWAYLQPMESSPSISGRRFWNYLTCDFLRPLFRSVKMFVVHWWSRICNCNWFKDALWFLLCR